MILEDRSSSNHPLGEAVETFIRSEDCEQQATMPAGGLAAKG